MSDTLQQAREAWAALADLRRRRERYKNYTYGRQWSDLVTVQGQTITEEQHATISGKKPLTNNLIRQLVKNVVGRFRHMLSEQSEPSPLSAEIRSRNMLDELDCRLLEEFLISGCAIQRLCVERRPGGSGVWVDNVSPDNFFCNRFSDPRGNDLELLGMLHDMSLREVQIRFAPHSDAAQRRIAAIYADIESLPGIAEAGLDYNSGFDRAAPGRCRVIEVWSLESRRLLCCHDLANGDTFTLAPSERHAVGLLNGRRAAAGMPHVSVRPADCLRWVCRFYAPSGELLASHDSPFEHGSHPFVVKFYPLIDGEVHSFVEDIIDSQRYINRLITMIDHVMSVSAKGVLLFPVDQKPFDLSWNDVALRWANPNGIIPYVSDGTSHAPHQVVGGNSPAGAYELLALELKLMQQISGVSGALAGQIDSAGTSAAMFEAQSRNSAIALLDIYECFNSLRKSRDKKIISL